MRYLNSTNHAVFKATNKFDLATELYETSWQKTDSYDFYDWCEGAKYRIKTLYDIDVSCHCPIDFIDALLENNLIVEIN